MMTRSRWIGIVGLGVGVLTLGAAVPERVEFNDRLDQIERDIAAAMQQR
jgi:hypothetical protein